MVGDKIRVLIADDHAILRSGLRLLLEAQPDMEVVGEAESVEEAVALEARLRPDVVLMDLTLPARPGGSSSGVAGLEAIRRIRSGRLEARVLALTMHDDEAYLRAVLEAGGVGYVLKQAADTELLSAIRAAYRGGTYLHPAHVRVLVEGLLRRGEVVGESNDYERLSPREQEVLRLLALGYTNQQVADQLCLSVKTIETYRSRLVEKLGLRSRADIVRYALQRGLLGSEGPSDS